MGLGYVGLPLAIEFGREGFEVVGIDLDAAKCDLINGGASDVSDVPHSAVAALTATGKLLAVPDIGLAGNIDTINICVPTPLRKNKEPDLSYVVSATRAVRTQLRPGMLVILESTTYPGATEEVVRNILEGTGLKVGREFFLAFSPERLDPANKTWNIKNVPKVVGGVTEDCTTLAVALYEQVIDQVVTVSSPRVAEMAKLLENTFRAVNIGLVNELALMCERIGISIWEVIAAAETKPFGFMRFHPGPGLGGHCIPIDSLYLSWKLREVGFEARFIELADQMNAAMPHHVVDKIGDALNRHGKAIRGSRIVLLGVAYKPNVGDVRESPALDVMGLLDERGARISYSDPFVTKIDAGRWRGGYPVESTSYSRELIVAADCVVVLTDHEAFDFNELAAAAPLIVDTRNAVPADGANVFRIGAPNPFPADATPPRSYPHHS